MPDGATPADTDTAGVEWLCRPGQADDPCTSSLTTTVMPGFRGRPPSSTSPTLRPEDRLLLRLSDRQPRSPAIVANLHIDPAEIVGRRSPGLSSSREVCRVYAPMYPQLTLHAIGDTGRHNRRRRSEGLRAESPPPGTTTSQHYNDGRGVVVIGHSQGAAILIALLRQKVDDDPAVRKLPRLGDHPRRERHRPDRQETSAAASRTSPPAGPRPRPVA